MTIWRSPVFYFGVILTLIVGAALVAPFVVDWGRYRSHLESYGTELTGQSVTISGPIRVRLFPWPRLEAEGVKIASPQTGDGGGAKPLLIADHIIADLTPGALLNGRIQVEKITLQRPVVVLQYDDHEESNWQGRSALKPETRRLLDHVVLDKITLVNGTFIYENAFTGRSFTFNHINTTVSAPHFRGPWRSEGDFTHLGTPYHFGFSTGELEPGEPLQFSGRVNYPVNFITEVEGLFTFGKAVDGKITLRPAEQADKNTATSSDGREDLRTVWNSSTLSAQFETDFTTYKFRDIQVNPQNQQPSPAQMGGNVASALRFTGEAKFNVGLKPSADIRLQAPVIHTAGLFAESVSYDEKRENLDKALQKLFQIDPQFDLNLGVETGALHLGDGVIENFKLTLNARQELVRIQTLSGQLPGRSRFQFNGALFPQKASELAGQLNFETNDLRSFLSWLRPDLRDLFLTVWEGERGDFKLGARLTLAGDRLALTEGDYTLNNEKGHLAFNREIMGDRPVYRFWLDTTHFDLDRYVPQGLKLSAGAKFLSWQGIFERLAAAKLTADLHLTLQAENVKLNAIEAHDVTIDIDNSSHGFEIKQFEIGSVGGGHLEALGELTNTPTGLVGDVDVALTAEAPQALLQFLGVISSEMPLRWKNILGKTDLLLKMSAGEVGKSPHLGFQIEGQTGDLTLMLGGGLRADNSANDKGLLITGQGEVRAATSSSIARLFGVTGASVDMSPATLTFTVDGSSVEGLNTDLAGIIYGASYDFSGHIHPFLPKLGVVGFVTLEAVDTTPVFSALGVPLLHEKTGAFEITSRINSSGGNLQLNDIAGKFAGVGFKGEALLADAHSIKADFSIETASILGILLPSFLPWDGKSALGDQPFARSLPFGLMGDIWIRPRKLKIYEGFELEDAQIGIQGTDQMISFTAYAKARNGDKVAVDLQSEIFADMHKITGVVNMPFDLSQQLRLATGGAPFAGLIRLESKFSGEGRNPGGVLATLSGTGKYTVQDGQFTGFNLPEFAKKIGQLKSADALPAAFNSLREGGVIALGNRVGALNVAGGIVSLSALEVSEPHSSIMLKPIIDLNTGVVEVPVIGSLREPQNLPPLTLTFAGYPRQLAVMEDYLALSAAFGFKLLNQGVGQLEKLQAEQARLALEEKQQIARDHAKLEAYQAQRAELRLRLREQRIHADQRLRDAAERKLLLDRLIKEGEAQNNAEQLKFLNQLAPTKQQPAAAGGQRIENGPREKPKTIRPLPKKQVPPASQLRETQVPLILVPPASP